MEKRQLIATIGFDIDIRRDAQQLERLLDVLNGERELSEVTSSHAAAKQRPRLAGQITGFAGDLPRDFAVRQALLGAADSHPNDAARAKQIRPR